MLLAVRRRSCQHGQRLGHDGKCLHVEDGVALGARLADDFADDACMKVMYKKRAGIVSSPFFLAFRDM